MGFLKKNPRRIKKAERSKTALRGPLVQMFVSGLLSGIELDWTTATHVSEVDIVVVGAPKLL